MPQEGILTLFPRTGSSNNEPKNHLRSIENSDSWALGPGPGILILWAWSGVP